MTDDRSTPTGEHLRDDYTDEPTPVPDLLPRTDDADVRLLDAFLHELSVDASNDLALNTADEQDQDDELMSWASEMIARSPSRGRPA